jgi:hypothetical protein
MVVVRAFADTKAVVAILNSGRAVLVVMRASDDARRIIDLLAGWAIGSGGELERIGANTVLARPPGSGQVYLSRSGIASAVEEIFAIDGPGPLTREDEEQLLPLAVGGSPDARRRVIDAYTETATLFALTIRPRSISEGKAVQVAQQELDRLVSFPSRGPLLASLVQGIIQTLLP